MPESDRNELTRRLLSCSDGELCGILADLFEARQPHPEEAAYCRHRFFLGIATSEIESLPEEPERWGTWRLHAVAHPDPHTYGSDLDLEGFSQSGHCDSCGTKLRSSAKQARCPICGKAVSLT